MGQKISPVGFRLARNKRWKSVWYANNKDFGELLFEDDLIRKFLAKRPSCVGLSSVLVKRMNEKVELTLTTARPGLVIGKKGAEIELLKTDLRKLLNKEVWVEVEEVKRPDLDAYLVAENIAKQLQRRVPYRRALKKSLQTAMDAGAIGFKVRISGRVGGAEIARAEWYKEGCVPLHTLRADIDYANVRSETTYGSIGVKVWIHKGEDVIKGE